MPNKITYTVQATNTTKSVEYWNPYTNQYQDTNPLTGIPGGSYSGLKARLKGSNPAIIAAYSGSVTVTDLTGRLGKDAIIGIGDSIERADQATVEAGFATGTGTTSFQAANGATGNVGKQTSTEKAVDILNTNTGNNRFDAYSVGYPSKTSFYFIRNYLTHFFDTFDFSKYDSVLVSLAFGANDLIYPEQSGDSTNPSDIYAAIVDIANTLKAVNSKIKIFISPTLNRTYNDSPGHQQTEFVDFDTKRQTLNNLLLTNISSYGSGAANIFAQTIGLKNTPFNYPNDWFSDGSHPTVKGQGEIGLERARMIARYLGLTLTQGNGTEPIPPTVVVTPTNPTNPANNEIVAYRDTNNVVDNGNNTLLVQGVGTNYFSAYANGTKKINLATMSGSVIKFPSITRTTGGKGILLTLCTNYIPSAFNSSILPKTKYILYSDGDILRTFVNYPNTIKDVNWIAQVGYTVELSIAINPSGKPTGVYFYEGSTQIDYNSDVPTTDMYVVVGGSDDGTILPSITITSPDVSTY